MRVCLLLVFYSIEANCIPVGEFFPFGTAAGDVVLSGDSIQLFLNPLFPILGEEKTSLIVNIVGVISFEDSFTTYVSRPFPYIHDDMLICPLWTDLWYRSGITTLYVNSVLDINKKIRITQLIEGRLGYTFIPTGVFIATWDDVAYFSDVSNTNTFQCVLTTNGQDTFVFFLYADGQIRLDPNYPIQIGIDGGDRVNHYTVPNSLTPDIVNITRTSNVNQPGLWILKVDDYNIIGGAPDVSAADLMVTDAGDTHATLEWTLNTTSDKPETFVVTCVPDEASPHTNTINVTVQLEELAEYTNTTQQTNFTYQITGLQEYTSYTCFLTARNIFGDGPSSHAINVTTTSAAPSGEPEDVRTVSLSPTYFLLEWDPPLEEDRNGVLTGYRLVLEWEVGQEYRVNTTHTSYNFTQLQQGTTYYCAVAAYTAIGTGPYYRTSVSTPIAPTPTPSITTPASSSLPPFTSAPSPDASTSPPHMVLNTTNGNDNSLVYAMAGGVGGTLAVVVMVIVITALLVIVVCKTKSKPTQNMEEPKHVYSDHETEDHVYETNMDVGQEVEEQAHVYEEMQYKGSDTPTAAKHEGAVKHEAAVKHKAPVRYLKPAKRQQASSLDVAPQNHYYMKETRPQQDGHDLPSQHTSTRQPKKKIPTPLPKPSKGVPMLPPKPVPTGTSEGVYMPLSVTRSRQQEEDHYMPLCDATRERSHVAGHPGTKGWEPGRHVHYNDGPGYMQPFFTRHNI